MKKLISLTLTIVLLLGSMNVAAAAASPTGKFKDVKDNHWARSAIEEAAKKGFITGYPDGTFKPESNITRAEFASILAKATKLSAPNVSPEVFADVPAKNWARKSIDKLVSVGIIDPGDYKKGSKASDKITRFEMVKWMISGLAMSDPSFRIALDETQGTLVPFTEFYKGGLEARQIPYVAVARGTQLTLGLPDGSFGVKQPTTRAEVAVIMQRYIGLESTNADSYRELTELRDVAKTGTNMMVFDAKLGLSDDNKPLPFENILNKEVKTKTGGKLKIHRYIVVDQSLEQKNKPVGVFANMFVDDELQKFSNTYSCYIELTYTPAVSNMNNLNFLGEVASITGDYVRGDKPEKFGYPTYGTSNFTKGKEMNMWVHIIYKRDSFWTDIKASDGSKSTFRFN